LTKEVFRDLEKEEKYFMPTNEERGLVLVSWPLLH